MLRRLLLDVPAAGAWNMAVDEALLESAALANVLTLRFYRWSEPTLSLGYFQPYEDRRQHPASLSCACVRRSSGGGAILHDRELTYSLAVPPSHPLARSSQDLYRAMHDSLVACLRRFGVDASLVARAAAIEPQPFLCFQRHTTGDVIVDAHKIAGSAQRRWRGAVLQHGSILLAASPAAPELPGLNDLCSQPLTAEQLIADWQLQLPDALSNYVGHDRLPEDVQSRAMEILAAKYAQNSWTRRR
jgi:lipoate-protein ligase A